MSLGFAYNLLKDGVRLIQSRQYSGEAILEARAKWYPQFYQEIYRCWKEELRQDANIVNLKHVKNYPDSDFASKFKGISPWFRIGLVQALSDEFAVMHKISHLKPFESGWIHTRYDDEDPEVIRAYRIGYIKYEHVAHVDWSGDKYTNLPVIYCRFRGKETGTPYDRVSHCTEGGDDRFPPSYFEFENARNVIRNDLVNG